MLGGRCKKRSNNKIPIEKTERISASDMTTLYRAMMTTGLQHYRAKRILQRLFLGIFRSALGLILQHDLVTPGQILRFQRTLQKARPFCNKTKNSFDIKRTSLKLKSEPKVTLYCQISRRFEIPFPKYKLSEARSRKSETFFKNLFKKQ